MSINLRKASLQRIFEYGLRAIRKQGKPAMSARRTCVYQTQDGGDRCIVGHLLTQSQIEHALSCNVGSLSSGNGLAFFEPILGPKPVLAPDMVSMVHTLTEKKYAKWRLLALMQKAHDTSAQGGPELFMHRFEKDMAGAAQTMHLRYPAPGEQMRA